MNGDRFAYLPDERNRLTAPGVEAFHLGGVSWFDAPTPRRVHRCTAQTWGYVNYFDAVERCACGAIRQRGGRRWAERNSRRAS